MTAVSPSLLRQFPLGPLPARTVNVGIVGLGGVARNAHLPACIALREAGWPLRIVAACDSVPERLTAALAPFPECRPVDAPDAIFDDPDIDAVLLLTPPTVSLELTQRALVAGKAVLVEKPVACDAMALSNSIELLGSLSDRAQVAYNRRFQPLGALARNELSRMGAVRQVTARLWRAARSRRDFYEDVPVHALDWLGAQFGPLRFKECTVTPPTQPGGLAVALELKLIGSPEVEVRLDVRPATGQTEETYFYQAAGGSVRLGYLVHEATRAVAPAELRMQRPGAPDPVLLFEKNDLSSADANFLRGFVHQLAAFLRFVADPSVPSPCTLNDALRALRLSEQLTGAMSSRV